MQQLRITAIDGTVEVRPLDSARISVGRDPDNDLQLDAHGVSRHHCVLEVGGGKVTVKDRASANGTFINNHRLTEPGVLGDGDRLYVGSFLLEIVTVAIEERVTLERSRPRFGIRPTARQVDERELQRLDRWATEWYMAGRPGNRLLHPRALRHAERVLLEQNQVGPHVRPFVDASRRAVQVRRRTIAMSAVAMGLLLVGGIGSVVATSSGASEPPPTTEAPSALELEPTLARGRAEPEPPSWLEHDVIPAETLEEIARRYGVSVANLARWNRLNPDQPELAVGQTLRVKSALAPLPRQQIEVELEHKTSWLALSERFGLPIHKLRAYNPEARLRAGERIVLWIDPQPYDERTELVAIPEFAARPDARSFGRPNDGWIENAIQMPASDLYTRRAPFIMWGNSHTIENLQTALATFRQRVHFDGVVVVADISLREGGPFPPHKSHQAGRDVDIWMPTLRGVYRESHLGRERKPLPNEIDWFATWGLVRALIDTGEVVHIFLEYDLQAKVHHAAELMGATPGELAHAMQWPRGPFASGVLAHSPGHTGHIHVRFKCGPHDVQCRDDIAALPHQEHEGD